MLGFYLWEAALWKRERQNLYLCSIQTLHMCMRSRCVACPCLASYPGCCGSSDFPRCRNHSRGPSHWVWLHLARSCFGLFISGHFCFGIGLLSGPGCLLDSLSRGASTASSTTTAPTLVGLLGVGGTGHREISGRSPFSLK